MKMVAHDMLKVIRDQLDRLQETSPQIPNSVIQSFKKIFGSTTPELSKPEITNGLDPINIYEEGSSPDGFKTSISYRTPNTSQMSSSARPRIESVTDSSHTSFSSCNTNTT